MQAFTPSIQSIRTRVEYDSFWSTTQPCIFNLFSLQNVANSHRNGPDAPKGRAQTYAIINTVIGNIISSRGAVRSGQQRITLPIAIQSLTDASNMPLSLFLYTYATFCHVTWQSCYKLKVHRGHRCSDKRPYVRSDIITNDVSPISD